MCAGKLSETSPVGLLSVLLSFAMVAVTAPAPAIGGDGAPKDPLGGLEQGELSGLPATPGMSRAEILGALGAAEEEVWFEGPPFFGVPVTYHDGVAVAWGGENGDTALALATGGPVAGLVHGQDVAAVKALLGEPEFEESAPLRGADQIGAADDSEAGAAPGRVLHYSRELSTLDVLINGASGQVESFCLTRGALGLGEFCALRPLRAELVRDRPLKRDDCPATDGWQGAHWFATRAEVEAILGPLAPREPLKPFREPLPARAQWYETGLVKDGLAIASLRFFDDQLASIFIHYNFDRFKNASIEDLLAQFNKGYGSPVSIESHPAASRPTTAVHWRCGWGEVFLQYQPPHYIDKGKMIVQMHSRKLDTAIEVAAEAARRLEKEETIERSKSESAQIEF